MSRLDPVAIGQFWSSRRAKFPKRELHPPIVDRQSIAFVEGVGPIRVWLVSADEEYLLQIQPDRFYFNWRKRSDEYPRFGDHEGKPPGVLSRGLRAFASFAEFCATELGQAPALQRLELAKISLLVRQKHWSDTADLVRLVPAIAPLVAVTKAVEPNLQLHVADTRDDVDVQLSLRTTLVLPELQPALHVESRAVRRFVDGDPRAQLLALNDVTNDIFFGLVPPPELDRFGDRQP